MEKKEKNPQYFDNFIHYLTKKKYPPGLGKNEKRSFRSVAKKYCVESMMINNIQVLHFFSKTVF